MSVTLTPELLSVLRNKAMATTRAEYDSDVVLALLDRIGELEKGLLEMGGIALKNAVEKHGSEWHGRWCGCASCIAAFPRRFAAPRDP